MLGKGCESGREACEGGGPAGRGGGSGEVTAIVAAINVVE